MDTLCFSGTDITWQKFRKSSKIIFKGFETQGKQPNIVQQMLPFSPLVGSLHLPVVALMVCRLIFE
jgi:hypothetical protein